MLRHGSVAQGRNTYFDGDWAGTALRLDVVDCVALLQVLEAAIGHTVAVEIELAAHTVENETMVRARFDQRHLTSEGGGAG